MAASAIVSRKVDRATVAPLTPAGIITTLLSAATATKPIANQGRGGLADLPAAPRGRRPGRDAQGQNHGREQHNSRELGDRRDLAGALAVLKGGGGHLRNLVDGRPAPEAVGLSIEMQKMRKQRIDEHRDRAEDRDAGNRVSD